LQNRWPLERDYCRSDKREKNLMNNVIIKPYASVGKIRLGTTIEEVTSTVGLPERTSTARDGETVYHYPWGLVNFSLGEQKVDEVTLFEGVKAYIEGIDLFRDCDVVRKLCNIENQIYECVGFLFCLDLGIILSGFHKEESEKIVAAFRKGRVDHLRDMFKPFRL